MSHGFAACSGYIVNDLGKWMDELGLPHYTILEDLLDEHEKDFTGLQEILTSDPVSVIDKPILDAYENLQAAFEQATGLGIAAGYHCPDDGDRFDEVSGVYWYLTGVIQLTPAAQKCEDKFEEKFWVHFNH